MLGFVIRIGLTTLGLLWALSAAGTPAVPIVQDALIVHADNLEYHGKRVRIPIKRKNLIHVFGHPSRKVYDAAGNVQIWDDLGLSCFDCQKPNLQPEELKYMSSEEAKAYKPNDVIGTLTIYIRKYDPYARRKRKFNHEPRFSFPGVIRLQGVDLDGTTTIKQFIAKRNSKQTILLPDTSFSFYIRCKPTPQEITLYTIRDKYSDDYLDIYAVSISNVGRFYKKLPCREDFKSQERHELEQKKLEEERLQHPEQLPKRSLPVPAGEN